MALVRGICLTPRMQAFEFARLDFRLKRLVLTLNLLRCLDHNFSCKLCGLTFTLFALCLPEWIGLGCFDLFEQFMDLEPFLA